MSHSRPPSVPLKWNTTFAGSSPIWPSEPAVSDIISVASEALYQHLRGEYPSSIHVNFFAQGTFNKIYEIIIPNQEHRYLFRVTLPVDPFLKIESEVATLAFLRQKTSIPVPEVVAWSSTVRNTIGYEWILLKKVKGVPLEREWRAMPMDAKIRISERLAAYVAELRALAFDKIGSLYFEDTNSRTLEANSSAHSQQIKFMSDFLGKDVEVGKMVLPFLLLETTTIYSSRPPFNSSHQFLTAKIQLQAAWIKSRVKIAESKDASDIDSDCDKDLVEEAPEMLDVCETALKLASHFTSSELNVPDYTLFHHDLNQNNVIINPTIHEIVAIIDWEMTCVLPRWDSFYYPKIFLDIDPVTEEEPPIPVECSDENDYTIIRRDRWDARILRRAFDGYIRGMSDASTDIFLTEGSNGWEGFEMKRTFDDAIENLTDNWEGARAQMLRLQGQGATTTNWSACVYSNEGKLVVEILSALPTR